MNLTRAINRLIAIEPQLSDSLMPIRDRYQMQPRRSKIFWKQLFEVLNTEPYLSHPRRKEMRLAIIDPPKRRQVAYTFKEVSPGDRVLGIIPENLADKLRRFDRRTIELAKKNAEADMTDDQQTKARIIRTNEIQEIELQKLWISIKDHFQIWGRHVEVTVKKQGPTLVLIEKKVQPQANMKTPFGMIPMNPEQLKKFFEQLGMTPPPGMFPEENDGD